MSSTVISRKRRNSTVTEPDSSGETRKQKKSRSDEKSSSSKDGDPQLEFKVLQGYRDLESEMHKGRAQVTRTGDIGVAMDNLNAVDSLFNKVIGIKNNGLFAHDARAMVSISELAQISVRNLKFDDSRSMVNLENIVNSLKRYMLKEHFKLNNIAENRNDLTLAADEQSVADQQEESDGDIDRTPDDNHTNKATSSFKATSMRHSYLQQFSHYNEFSQFNWFRIGALYNTISKNAPITDHLMGPLSIEKKPRVLTPRRRNNDQVGEKITAEKITQHSLNSTQQETTPEQVKKCFKKLSKKLGPEGSINLFKFIIDPNSFSRSIENLFYTSFLIKEGKLLMEHDEEGLPTIKIKQSISHTDSRSKEIERQRRRAAHQNHIIFQMDMPTWRKLIKKYNITSPFLD
ncbi:BAH_G0007550.mRNA.1.CDS.1 [Saccharomyces cerevisiae]|nr:SX2_G0042710.mRNA.1.CDS.1 [Saccharomyces cerevisiae]CAI4311305.1 BAG_1a_G0007680.mRNA.1.CDS.1 [Saccharomyces cerevisiae]CAI4313136.1 BAH_G0007550.mRNA.1.CDS.1 [Saccharomyces cerevisiae]CAI7063226.1 BAH_G0007550.mRNA.1.CDS.1 [Saccharomyces cerevisiae]CAI7063756.1 BAG_1a_G0007680.mRNA.1.CDS.1 [Saccharomyces cerevisiae]